MKILNWIASGRHEMATVSDPVRSAARDGIRRRLRRFGIALLMMSAGSAALAGQAPGFYDAATSDLAGAPGSLIRYEVMGGAPQGAQAYRILYRSRDAQGRPIAVSGMVIVPQGAAPAGGRPVVAWAHPTTGVVPACAPSRAVLLRYIMVAGLPHLLERGYVVAATDYPGAADGAVQPFLDGPAEARAVLDSIRAAGALPSVSTNGQFALWGHSQGGQAVLFTAQMAAGYAPELRLAGVAAAAPATDLAVLFRDDLGTDGGNNLAAYALFSWANVFGAAYDGVVQPAARPEVAAVAGTCIDTLIPSSAKREADRVFAQGFLTVPDITQVQPWQGLIARNTPGTLPPAIPVFLAQGTTDVIVRPAVTQAYMARLCRAGSRVTFDSLPNVGHGLVAMRASPTAVAWMADRFAGVPAPSDCAGAATAQ